MSILVRLVIAIQALHNIPGPNAENVTVLFNDNKYIELGPQFAEFNQVSWGGRVGGGNFSADMEFGFLDELGNVILSQVLSNDIIATSFHGRNLNITTALVAYGMFFNTSPIGPLDANARIEFNLNGVVGSVPEPGTLVLFALGLAGLGFRKMKLR